MRKQGSPPTPKHLVLKSRNNLPGLTSNAFHARGEDDRAIADYTQAIEIYPKLAQAYAKRGVAYEAIGRREEAIADYRRAVAIDGNEFSKDALKRLGQSQ
jgi:tetratricopeptide (TPR) repeat protein